MPITWWTNQANTYIASSFNAAACVRFSFTFSMTNYQNTSSFKCCARRLYKRSLDNIVQYIHGVKCYKLLDVFPLVLKYTNYVQSGSYITMKQVTQLSIQTTCNVLKDTTAKELVQQLTSINQGDLQNYMYFDKPDTLILERT